MSFEHLDDETNISGVDIRVFWREFVRQRVYQRLAVVQVPEDVLGLFQVANRAVHKTDAGHVADLGRVAELLERDAGRVASIREVHAGGMLDRVLCCTRPFYQRLAELLTPGARHRRPGPDPS